MSQVFFIRNTNAFRILSLSFFWYREGDEALLQRLCSDPSVLRRKKIGFPEGAKRQRQDLLLLQAARRAIKNSVVTKQQSPGLVRAWASGPLCLYIEE